MIWGYLLSAYRASASGRGPPGPAATRVAARPGPARQRLVMRTHWQANACGRGRAVTGRSAAPVRARPGSGSARAGCARCVAASYEGALPAPTLPRAGQGLVYLYSAPQQPCAGIGRFEKFKQRALFNERRTDFLIPPSQVHNTRPASAVTCTCWHMHSLKETRLALRDTAMLQTLTGERAKYCVCPGSSGREELGFRRARRDRCVDTHESCKAQHSPAKLQPAVSGD